MQVIVKVSKLQPKVGYKTATLQEKTRAIIGLGFLIFFLQSKRLKKKIKKPNLERRRRRSGTQKKQLSAGSSGYILIFHK